MSIADFSTGVVTTTDDELPTPDNGRITAEAIVSWVSSMYTPSVDQDGNAVLLDHRTRRAIPMETAAGELKATLYLSAGIILTDAVEKQAFGVVAALATRNDRCVTALRRARVDNTVWLDTGDAVVSVTANGWAREVTPDSKRPFFLPSDPIPFPATGGVPGDFAAVLGLPEDDSTFRLFWLWLAGTVALPGRPMPLLWLLGEPGSAKSSRGLLVKSVIAPSTALSPFPDKFTRDLEVTLSQTPVVGFDDAPNMKVDGQLSKSLTRLVTGMEISRRVLYTNGAIQKFVVKVPAVVTSVHLPPGLQQDNLQRMLPVHLPKTGGRTETEVLRHFADSHARILGAVLDAISAALAADAGRPETLNRLGDLHMLAVNMQAASGLPYADDFTAAIDGALMDAAWEEPFIRAVVAFMNEATSSSVSMTAGEWLDALTAIRLRLGIMLQSTAWPEAASGVGTRFGMRAGVLRQLGINVEDTREYRDEAGTGRRRVRVWRLTRTGADS